MWPSQGNTMSDRKCTDISSLFICTGFIILMFILVIYSATHGDIDRLSKGYDDCGNICGHENADGKFEQCGSYDKRKFPKVLVKTHIIGTGNDSVVVSHFDCIAACPKTHIEVLNRCWKRNGTFEDENDEFDAQDLLKTWPYIAINCFVSFVFSFILLMLFRYAIEYVIWIIYSSVIVLFLLIVIFSMYYGFFILTIIFGLFAIVGIIVLWVFKDRIRMVAQLFKEASKALIDLPQILFEPVLTFLSLLLAIIPFIYFCIIIATSGDLTEGQAADGKFQATFQQDSAIGLASFINFVAFIWFTQFILGCQHFIIGGTISKWYFSRDKTKIFSPLKTTFSQLVNYHLGSICLGSMLITFVKIMKMIISSIKYSLKKKDNYVARKIISCCEWIAQKLDELLRYLVRNAYIIVAKDGTPFIESGKRAFDLLFRNLTDVIALNYFGDFVLVLGKIFVVVISAFTGYELMKNAGTHSPALPLLISIFFAYLIAHCFVTVFEMTVDTIFICFCEDCEQNDGNEKPYFMSPTLMQIMKEMKESTGGQFDFSKNYGTGIEAGPSQQQQDKSPFPRTPEQYQQSTYPMMPVMAQPEYNPIMQQQGYPMIPQEHQEQYVPVQQNEQQQPMFPIAPQQYPYPPNNY